MGKKIDYYLDLTKLMLIAATPLFLFFLWFGVGLEKYKHERDVKQRVELLGKQHSLSTEGIKDILCIGGYLHYLPDVGKNVFRYEPLIECNQE